MTAGDFLGRRASAIIGHSTRCHEHSPKTIAPLMTTKISHHERSVSGMFSRVVTISML